jgi:hypothetical protein
MASTKCRQSFAILQSRRSDQGITKFQSMAPTISPKALTGQLTSGGVNGHSVQACKEGRDPGLLSGSHACSYLGSAHG